MSLLTVLYKFGQGFMVIFCVEILGVLEENMMVFIEFCQSD
jgi:hypothetical protein